MPKKFSMQAVLACALAATPALHAQPAAPAPSPALLAAKAANADSGAATAGAVPAAAVAASPDTTAAAALAGLPELADDAPDKYVVVRGDTLWDISGKFLKKPWRWPEIWQLNREQIRNPHLIYPGDVVYLDRSGGTVRLRLGKPVGGAAPGGEGAGLRTERLAPRTRVEPLAEAAIPTVPARLIEPFLNRPLIVDERGLATNPRILGAPEARVYLGRGDLVYARGIPDDTVTDWHVYRQARPILDPDTRKPIAWEALFIGSARLERAGDIAQLRLTSANEEIGEGDRLMPAANDRPMNYAPHPPEGDVAGKIVSIHRGVRQVGRGGVVAVNVGGTQGLEVGHVLAIQSAGRMVPDRESGKRGEMVKLPDLEVGHLLVFRVFDRIAYGLVMDAQRSIEIGDTVTRP